MPGSTERLIRNLDKQGYVNLADAVRSPERDDLIKEGAFGHLNVKVIVRDLSDYGRQLFEESLAYRPMMVLPCAHLQKEFGKMEVQSDKDTRFKESQRAEYNRLYVVYIQRIQDGLFNY